MQRLIVYVGCSVTNGSKDLESFIDEFKKGLRMATSALVLEWIGNSPDRTINDLYTSDFNNVRHSDAIIAIVDEPSIGLGMEIQEAIVLKRPILCLYRHGRVVSRLLKSAADAGAVPLRTYRDAN